MKGDGYITGETVQLAVLGNTQIVFVAFDEPERPVKPNVFLGKTARAHATATGKVLLAFNHSENEIRQLYPTETLSGSTQNTLRSREQLIVQIADIRHNGFARTRQKSSLGICCLAAL